MAATDSKLATQIKATHPGSSPGWDPMEAAVELITNAISGGLPTWNSRSFTYIGATNNASVVTYKLNGVSVATVTYTYVAAGAADDDDVLTETLAIL